MKHAFTCDAKSENAMLLKKIHAEYFGIPTVWFLDAQQVQLCNMMYNEISII